MAMKEKVNLKAELHQVFTLLGLVVQVILSNNDLIEYVNLHIIYRVLHEIFQNLFNKILYNKEKKKEKKEGSTKKEVNEHYGKHEKSEKPFDEDGKKLKEEINNRFIEIFYESKKSEFFSISNIKSIKYAVVGCVYLFGKMSNQYISLRNILNTVDFHFYLLNHNINIHQDSVKNSQRKITSCINRYIPINKESVYFEKEECLKMERVSLHVSNFNFSNNVGKYSLLYELMFIMRSPLIINKFLLAVLNDVVCIPNVREMYSDVVIVITSILYVNHFFYYIYKKTKKKSKLLFYIKREHYYQTNKILQIFQLVYEMIHASEIASILSLFQKIVHLYSIPF